MTRYAGPLLAGLAALLAWPVGGEAAMSPAPQIADTVFRHAAHAEVSCLECHRMESGHGTLLVRDFSDCRGCHHVRQRVNDDCTACHARSDLRGVVYRLQRGLRLSVLQDVSRREIQFDHADHVGRDCADCHTGGPSFAVTEVDCGSCHEEHHDPTVSACMNCHLNPSSEDHPLEVHATCSGAGCHTDPPFGAPVRTRTGCLWCHEEKVDHEPEGDCVDCHFVNEAPGSSPYIHRETNRDAHM